MSNKIVPQIYRAVIDDVIANIKSEFDEYGVGEDVLAELQHKWQQKVIASHVAEFDTPHQSAASAHPNHPPYPPHPMHAHPQVNGATGYPPHNPYVAHHQVAPLSSPQIKTEPVDNRYMLGGQAMSTPYGLPPLAGPQIPGVARPANSMPYPHNMSAARPPANTPAPPPPTARYPPSGANRIPQVDGPSSSSSDSPSPPPSQEYAPRSSHPSLPQPAQSSSKADDEEAINSDLDDSDSDNDEAGEEGGGADTDIVFCTYDKVARVKNKWKCTLKDGMIHINGKDYLFAKCTGEFEW